MSSEHHVPERAAQAHVTRRSTRRLSRRSACIGLLAGGLAAATTMPVAAVRAAPAPPAGSTHVVQAGENLYRIALNLHVRLDDLLTANGLRLDSLILPGQQLVVPGASQPAAAPSVAGTRAAPAPVATSSIYAVQSGDGLYQIAQKLGVELDDLLGANGLKITSVIVPGQPLKVPANAKPLSITAPSVAGQPAERAASGAPATAPTTPAPTPSTVAPSTTAAPAPTTTAAQANLSQTPAAKAVAAVAYAQAQLGKPYQFAASGPDAFDCSGLTVAAYRTVGVKLPHHSATQATYGTAIDWRTQPILPGDLIFTHSSSGGALSHVGIAIDATHYIHSPRTGDVVRVAAMPSSTTIQAVRRIIVA